MDDDGNYPHADGGRGIQSLDGEDRRSLCLAIMGVDLTEVYSPERVVKLCSKFKLTPGCSFDIQNGWDFTKATHRAMATTHVKEDKPLLVIWAQPCTMMTLLQELNTARHARDPAWMKAFNERLEQAKEHVRFCCELYRVQIDAGWYWLHEHPWTSRSWKLAKVAALCGGPRVMLVQAHQRAFGLKAKALDGVGIDLPAKKPTVFLTNSCCIAEELDRTCSGGHRHAWLMQGELPGQQTTLQNCARPCAEDYNDRKCMTPCMGRSVPTYMVTRRRG